MPTLPKLKLKKQAWETTAEILDFEQAKTFPWEEELIIAVEGQQVCSYGDLLRLAGREDKKGKEFLDVIFFPMICGG